MGSSGGIGASSTASKCYSKEAMRIDCRKNKKYLVPTLEAGGWECTRCKNINFRHKLFCNMRKCQAPRPLESWTCKDCGHEEPNVLAPRCSECSVVRPLTRDDCIVINAHATGEIPLQFQTHSLMVQQYIRAPRGAWICSSCDNVNWPARTRCNGKNCDRYRGMDDLLHTKYVRELYCNVTHETLEDSKPFELQDYADEPEVEQDNDDSTLTSGSRSPSCSSVKVADRLSNQQRLADLAKTIFTNTRSWDSNLSVGDNLPGSWVCICGEVNWPPRDICNDCSIPRLYMAPPDA